MPRQLIIGNGRMFASFDENLEMRDFTFPHVGMEDHTAFGDRHRVGVWMEGKGIRWFSDAGWEKEIRYKPETLVGNSILANNELGIEISAEDFVHPVHNILLRRFSVRSTDNAEKEVRLFFHHDLHIYGDKQKDTAYFEPYTNTIINYRQTRYFLIGGNTTKPLTGKERVKRGRYSAALKKMEGLSPSGISSFTVGKNDFMGLEGTWRDAEDGVLSKNAVEQGSVDSTIAIHAMVGPDEPTEISMWLCAGKTLEEVIELHETVIAESPERLRMNCSNYWKCWVNKSHQEFFGLDKHLIDLYKRSLLIMRLHASDGGGIVAAADSDIMAFNRDTYSYVWPRDGAFVSMALDRAGYLEVTRRFFEFCSRIQSPDGYLLHKYNPDGSLGSTWHPWFRDGEPQLPIQEDGTALVIYALWKHFEKAKDFEFLQYMFVNFVRKAGNFMSEFREKETGLPLESYDPWEEHRGVFTYTTACTIAGLYAASQISNILGHFKHAERYMLAAEEMRQALIFHLFDEASGRFVKKIKRQNGRTTEKDITPDMSISAVWKLEILPADDPRVASTMKALKKALKVCTDVGGFARYTSDRYHFTASCSDSVPGNPWIITTLWNAQWDIERAKKTGDLAPALDALNWVSKHSAKSGILAEQLDAFTGKSLSVAPLTWSHAEFVSTILQYLEKYRILSSSA